MQTQTFVFFGIVGSGKGTQVKLLMDFLKNKDGKECEYAGTGEIYRKIVESPYDENAKILKDAMNKGKLMPDDFTDKLVRDTLDQFSPEKHWFFDGYPRTIPQSEHFEDSMKEKKRENIQIIYIELSKEEAMKRNLLRGRMDDTKEGLEKRFEEYEKKVIPAMNHFKDKKGYMIYTINGEQAVENVFKDIIKALEY